MSGAAKLVQRASHLVKVVAFIQAHTLGLVWTGRRSRHGQAVHRGPHQFHVMTVGPLHRQTHRNALGCGQPATLDPAFAAVSGVGAGFSPRPRAIWSWRRPYSANSSPAPSVGHSVPVPPATVPGTPQRQPIPESAGGRWTRNRCPWRPRLSSGRPPPNRWVFTRAGIRGASTSHSSSEIWNAPVVGLVLVAGPARFGRGGLGSFALVITPV